MLESTIKPHLLVSAILVTACIAHAEPLISYDGDAPKPGVITAWEAQSKKKVVLTVRDDVDIDAVVETITDNVERVRAKVRKGKVQVSGKTEADLLKALAEIDFRDDDMGGLAAADIGTEEELGSGSSLRAKKTADIKNLLADSKKTTFATITKVERLKFPHTKITAKIIRGPRGVDGKQITKGSERSFVPQIPSKAGAVDWTDGTTTFNTGAWYLRANDRVRIIVGKQHEDGSFSAEAVERY